MAASPTLLFRHWMNSRIFWQKFLNAEQFATESRSQNVVMSIPPLTTRWPLKDADIEQFRHTNCKMLIDVDGDKTVCDECFKLRRNLMQNYRRQQNSTTDRIASNSGVPLKHLTNDELLLRQKGLRSTLV